jgi:hypothetical protein
MMEALAALGQEASNRSIRIQWPNQLDPRRTGMQGSHFDTLFFQRESLTGLETDPPLALERRVEVGDNKGHMVQGRIRGNERLRQHQSATIGAFWP